MLEISVIEGTDLPIADRTTSDPYVKIFLDGAVKTFVGQTAVRQKQLNPKWNYTMRVPGVRGCKVFFEVWDSNIGASNIMGYCSFNPICMPFDKIFDIPLTCVITKGGKNAMIKICVKLIPNNPRSISPKSIFSTPIYVTFDMNTPFKMAISGNDMPYQIPFQLSALLFLPGNKCVIVNADDRSNSGVNHSGNHPIFTYNCFTQAIRVDPVVAFKSKVQSILFFLHTQNLKTLATCMDQPTTGGFTTIWSSNENPNSYKKTRTTTFKESEWGKDTSLTVSTRTKVDFQPSAVMMLIATARVDKSGIQIAPSNLFIPSPNQTITPQSVFIGGKIFLGNLNLTASSYPYGLPVCTPIVLKKVVPETVKSLKCKITNIKKHNIIAGLAQYDMKILGVYSKGKASIPAITFDNDGSINIVLDKLSETITYVMVGIHGDTPLRKEPHNESKIPGVVIPKFGDMTPTCQLQANGVYSLQDFTLPAARNRNSLKWFTLFREPFGNWAIISIRVPTNAKKEEDLSFKILNTTKLLFK